MDQHALLQLLKVQKKSGRPVVITVSGDSMYPVLSHLDLISIVEQDNYEIGDILVFVYRHNEILVHRCLKKTDIKYYCKGDNSFRLEDITKDQIIGRVCATINEEKERVIDAPDEALIQMSYAVNQEFIHNKYDIEKTKQSDVYHQYEVLYLKKKGETNETAKK